MVARTRPSWMASWEEDIVQLAMLRLARALARRPEQDDFPSAYLRRVAYTATFDEVRRHGSRSRTAPPDIAELAGDPMEDDLARKLEAQQTLWVVRTCLAELSPCRREAVGHYLEGLTIAETAERMGWSNKRTENLVYRGLAELREALRSRGIESSGRSSSASSRSRSNRTSTRRSA